MTSTDPLLTRVFTMLKEFSAESGRAIRRFPVFMPMDSANEGFNAFSTSK